MEDSQTEQVDWVEYTAATVGIRDKQIVCIIGKIPGFPCEAYTYSIVDYFVDKDAAKEAALVGLAEYNNDKSVGRVPTYAELMLPVLKSLVTTLETSNKQIEKGE